MYDFLQLLGFITCLAAFLFVTISCVTVWRLEHRLMELETKVYEAKDE